MFATLSHSDDWCGHTCHAVLRYVLRALLFLVLVGTVATIFVRTLDLKCWAELKRRLGLAKASSLLDKSRSGLKAGAFRDIGVGSKVEKNLTQLNGPDVKDSCAVV